MSSGANDCDSGLWHQAHLSGHPLKNTVVRIPGPSWVENRWMLKMSGLVPMRASEMHGDDGAHHCSGAFRGGVDFAQVMHFGTGSFLPTGSFSPTLFGTGSILPTCHLMVGPFGTGSFLPT